MTAERGSITGTVLVGRDLVSTGASLTIEAGAIAAIEPSSSAEPGLLIAPGFIDCHVHVGFAEPRDILVGGVTTVRDLAWPPDRIWPLVAASQEAGFAGPAILAAGQMLTVAGGYPTRAAWAPPGTGRVVESRADAGDAVAQQAEAGACVIKVALNPAVGSTLDAGTLSVICDAAHERGLRVTGHVYGIDELHKALDAGMDELAHMLMSPEPIPKPTVQRMVTAGMVVVPTLAVFYGRARSHAIANLDAFTEMGGRVVYGTDLGNRGPRPGIDRREIGAMSDAGMDPVAIIRSATVDAAAWLGLNDRGHVAEGMRADLVAFDAATLARPEQLARPLWTMRGGRSYDAPVRAWSRRRSGS